MALWTVHGDGKTVRPGEAVAPLERLSWPRTIGMGMQHVVAMSGATLLVPAITGFPATATLFFSAIGTFIFLLVNQNRLPSYLGSSFAFLAPIGAAATMGDASGGILFAGACLVVVGALGHFAGVGWIDKLMPPAVNGTIVALIGLNLAPAAWGNFKGHEVTGFVTILTVAIVSVLFKGILGRLSILVGIVVGYVVAAFRGEIDFGSDAIKDAAVVGLPDFHTPTFTDPGLLIMFVPVVLVLVAENIGHVKSVAAMTGENLDDRVGRSLVADGVSTMLAGAGGGSGTTTYAENIGVMAATRVYSTAVYWVAGSTALLLAFSPKVGAIIQAMPAGVLGGAGTILYGMIGLLGARIWVQNKVNFSDPVVLTSAAVALIMGIGDYTFTLGSITLGGIATGTIAALVLYHGMRAIARWRGTSAEPASPSSVPDTAVGNPDV